MSVNASNSIETPVLHEYLGRKVYISSNPQRFRWSKVGDPDSLLNNGYDDGINPQDSLETATI